MEDDGKDEQRRNKPANDNEPEGEPGTEVWRKIDHAALTLARIIGRRMAREDYAARVAANDNGPDDGHC